MDLRDYQVDAVDQAVAAVHRIKSGVWVIATGGGKTICFAEFARQAYERWGYRSLVLAHREELVIQAKDKIGLIWPDAEVGVVQAWRDEHAARHAVVASIQTLDRPDRLRKMGNFDIVVTDEAHHAVAQSYRDLITAFKPTFHLGVTATPKRTDGVGLSAIYEEVLFSIGTLELMSRGYLCDIRYVRIRTELDLSGVPGKSDFDERRLGSAVNTDNRNELILKAYLEHAKGQKSAGFCANVAHAYTLAKLFNEHDIPSGVISGSMGDEKRAKIHHDFETGAITVLFNFGVLVEGWDVADITCLLMCRPTKSNPLYTQILGRGLRLSPGKKEVLVLEFTDEVHNIVTVPSIMGFPIPEYGGRVLATVEKLEEIQKEELKLPTGDRVVARAEDIFGRSKLTWHFRDGEWWLQLGDAGRIRVAKHPDRLSAFQILHYESGSRVGTALTLRPVPADYALPVAEAKAREVLEGNLQLVSKDAAWRQYPATPSQLQLIGKMTRGRFRGDKLTRGQANEIIEQLKDGTYWPRLKAARLLKKVVR